MRTMAATAVPLLEHLYAVHDRIGGAEQRAAELRDRQWRELTAALLDGATVAEIVRAAGVSRAYLHRCGSVPLYTREAKQARHRRAASSPQGSPLREQALRTAGALREQVEEIVRELEALRRARNDLIRAAVRAQAARGAVANAAGVSSEWVRQQLHTC